MLGAWVWASQCLARPGTGLARPRPGEQVGRPAVVRVPSGLSIAEAKAEGKADRHLWFLCAPSSQGWQLVKLHHHGTA